jgi:hypothetical protein
LSIEAKADRYAACHADKKKRVYNNWRAVIEHATHDLGVAHAWPAIEASAAKTNDNLFWSTLISFAAAC